MIARTFRRFDGDDWTAAQIPSGAQIHPTSVVSSDAELGDGVTIAPHVVIHANVSIGDGTFVDSHAILGAPTAAYYEDPGGYEPEPCTVGPGSIIRSHSVLYAGVTVGRDFATGHHVTIREHARIGEGVRVGTQCDIQPSVTIGDYARLHSNVFVASRSTIEELTWLFPRAMLIDDPHPPSDTCTIGPTIRRFALVGAQSTILPAVEVGEGSLVAAMSLVREHVPAETVVAGVPAHVIGSTRDVVCRHGKLGNVYPWWRHFRRGYPEGVLPRPDDAGA